MTAPRVLLAEDEADAREMLRRGLARQGFVIEAVADGVAACAVLDRGWDIVVTDLVMPRLDGLHLLSEVRVRCPGAIRVVITSFGDKERVLAALNLGSHFLLEKPFTAQQLADVLLRLLAERGDGSHIDQLFARRLSTLPLTPRERELVVSVLKGLANRDIGRHLGITEQRVKNALHQIYSKLGVTTRGELFHLVFPV